MNNKYNEAISSIQVSENLKKRIISKMKEENIKKANKGGIIVKVKRGIIAIISTISLLIGSGVVYAAIGGTIGGKPALEWLGITFSDKYLEYVKPVENQFIENDKMRLDLISTVSDEGFVVLDFQLQMKDGYKNELLEKNNFTEEDISTFYEAGITQISFNDVYENIVDIDENGNKLITEEKEWKYMNSSFNKIIIDGEEFTVRGHGAEQITYKPDNEKFDIYQLYFLTDNELKDKENFTLTLKDPVLEILGENYEVINGEFNIQISKTEALANTEVFTNEEAKLYEQKIEKVIMTPLQNIIKITTIAPKDETEEGNIFKDEYYFRVYNNEQRIKPFIIYSGKVIYEDGTSEDIPYYELEDEKQKKVKDFIITNYIVIEKNENIEIEAYSNNNEYDENMRFIGIYDINLKQKTIRVKEKNQKLDYSYERYWEEELAFDLGQTLEEFKEEQENNYSKEGDTSILFTESSDEEENKETNNIEWEEYPSNIHEIANKALSKFFGVEDIQYGGNSEKMIYSIIKNKLYKNSNDSIFKNIIYQYSPGDYYITVDTDSNYNQYSSFALEDDRTMRKYNEIIKFKTAMINSSSFDWYCNLNQTSGEDAYYSINKKTEIQYEYCKANNSNELNNYYYGLDKIAIMNGDNTSKDRYLNNARAKKIKVTINNEKEYIFELQDTNKAQVFDLDYVQKTIKKPIDVSIEILDDYNGNKTNDIYISDIQFGVTTNIPMGI